jgi:probable addiction module antidote protein
VLLRVRDRPNRQPPGFYCRRALGARLPVHRAGSYNHLQMPKQKESRRAKDFREQLRRDLIDPEKAALYLNAAAERSDSLFILALRDVVEARRMPVVAKRAGMYRQGLYRMLSETGNPTHASLRKIMKAVGLKLVVEPVPSARRKGRSRPKV